MGHPVSTQLERTLDAAEAQLKDIIEECLTSRSYIEMSVVAGVADAIRTLSLGAVAQLDGRAGEPRSEVRPRGRLESEQLSEPAISVPTLRSANRQASKRADYPRFEREGERLIKIGWSKKERAEYEHKAPLTAVVAVCANLRQQTRAFAMEQILPMRDSAGTDIPSYQVYLVVTWLRQIGLVQRDRDEGYTALRARLDDESVRVAFHSLPSREHSATASETGADARKNS
jgi:hypothetical protein